jgi:hypothetical protein
MLSPNAQEFVPFKINQTPIIENGLPNEVVMLVIKFFK